MTDVLRRQEPILRKTHFADLAGGLNVRRHGVWPLVATVACVAVLALWNHLWDRFSSGNSLWETLGWTFGAFGLLVLVGLWERGRLRRLGPVAEDRLAELSGRTLEVFQASGSGHKLSLDGVERVSVGRHDASFASIRLAGPRHPGGAIVYLEISESDGQRLQEFVNARLSGDDPSVRARHS